MEYLRIAEYVTNIPITLLSLVLVHFVVFGIVGLFRRKRFPKTEKVNRYGIIIPARNEEKVVAGLIESVKKNRYPQDMLQIFVIAHNCTDRTAEISREHGATVYEYSNPGENTMGYAFRHLFSCIERDYGTKTFDGFFLFNADNILDIDYISNMNDAFEYYNRESVITSYRNSKNFGSNILSGLYGMYFAQGCRFEACGRTVLGCSTRVQGTGYLINSKIVENGWNYVSLTEDWEFSADQILFDNKIRYCDAAIFYDEQPTNIKIMWRQRVRWSRGHLLVFYARFRELFCHLFRKETRHRMSLYDITAYILPSPLIMLALQMIQFIAFIVITAVRPDVTLYDLFIGRGDFLILTGGLLFVWLRSAVTSYILMFTASVIIFISERKRIMGVSFGKKILISLLWPFFLLIQIPIDVQAFFSRNLGWKPIPHKDDTSFENVNDIGETVTD